MFAGEHTEIRHVQYTPVRQKLILLVQDKHLKSWPFAFLTVMAKATLSGNLRRLRVNG